MEQRKKSRRIVGKDIESSNGDEPEDETSACQDAREKSLQIEEQGNEVSKDMAYSFKAPTTKMIVPIQLDNTELLAKYFIRIRKKSKPKTELFSKALKKLIEKHGIVGLIHTKIKKPDISNYPHKCTALLMAICTMQVLNESIEKRKAFSEILTSSMPINDSNPFKYLEKCKISKSLLKVDLNSLTLDSLSKYLRVLKYWVTDRNTKGNDDLSDLNELIYYPWSRRIVNVMSGIASLMKINIELLSLDNINKLGQSDGLITSIKGGNRGTVVLGFNHYEDPAINFVRLNIFYNKSQLIAPMWDENEDAVYDIAEKYTLNRIEKHKIKKLFEIIHEDAKYEIKYLNKFDYSHSNYFMEKGKESHEKQKIFIENARTQIANVKPPPLIRGNIEVKQEKDYFSRVPIISNNIPEPQRQILFSIVRRPIV